MAETITPVVHGGSRRAWAGSLLAHAIGAVIAAAALGALLGGLGLLLGAPWGRTGAIAAAAAAALYLPAEFGVGVPVPSCAGRCRTGGGRSSRLGWPRSCTGSGSGRDS